jgi:hypothetical protein
VITPDSRSVFYHSQDENGKDGIFRVPIAGGESVRVGDFPSASLSGYLAMSSDSRQILAPCSYNTGWSDEQQDLSVLENFEPPAKK